MAWDQMARGRGCRRACCGILQGVEEQRFVARGFSRIGGHFFRTESGSGDTDAAGDILHWLIVDQVEMEDIKYVLSAIEQIAARHHHVFLIIAIKGAGGFAPAARRYYLEWRRDNIRDNRWVYVVGASVVSRALITLVLRGTKLVTGREPALSLVRDEAEARSRIAELRARYGY